MRTETNDTEVRQETAVSALARIRNVALPLILVGAIAVVAEFIVDVEPGKRAFWSSYFFAWSFWMGMTLGCTTALFLHNCTRAIWGVAIMRVLEAGTRCLPVMGVLFLPILIAMWNGQIYDWANPHVVQGWDYLHQRKAHFYLNPTFFTIRQVIYWSFWIFTTNWMRRSSLEQDRTMNERLGELRSSFAAPVGCIHIVLVTFAVTDWLLSLTGWYSTLFGAWVVTKNTLMATALGAVIVMANRYRRPYSEIVTPAVSRDLGNVLLGWTMFWGYTSISQFLIIWSGNLPDDNTFYVARLTGGLVYVGAFIVAFQFFAPFLSLITGRAKRTPEILLRVALWILAVRVVDNWWDVVPYFRTANPMEHAPAAFDPVYLACDIGAFLLFGGIWMAVFVSSARLYPLYPAHDPRLIESKELLTHGAH